MSIRAMPSALGVSECVRKKRKETWSGIFGEALLEAIRCHFLCLSLSIFPFISFENPHPKSLALVCTMHIRSISS